MANSDSVPQSAEALSEQELLASWAALDDDAAIERLCNRFAPGPAADCRRRIYEALAVAHQRSERLRYAEQVNARRVALDISCLP